MELSTLEGHTKEHKRELQLHHPGCSVAMEHAVNQDCSIHFKSMTVLEKQPYYTSRLICEVIEISLHYIISREGGCQLSLF